MYDKSIVEENKLPAKSVMNTYFLDLAARARTMLKDCITIRDLAWRIFNSINNQFETVYVAAYIKKPGYETSCRHDKFFKKWFQ